jgi:hypothetical protein
LVKAAGRGNEIPDEDDLPVRLSGDVGGNQCLRTDGRQRDLARVAERSVQRRRIGEFVGEADAGQSERAKRRDEKIRASHDVVLDVRRVRGLLEGYDLSHVLLTCRLQFLRLPVWREAAVILAAFPSAAPGIRRRLARENAMTAVSADPALR